MKQETEVHAGPYVHETQEVESTQLAVRTEITLFGTSEPAEVVERAGKVASALADVIRKKGLFKKIGPKEHVFVEGWTLCGSMLGVFPVCVWTRPIPSKGTDDNLGWEARVEARTIHGQIVGAAEAQCLYGERNWRDRDDFALRSMAQTRATSKALKMPLGFVLTLAGYSATPAEEMIGVASEEPTEPDTTDSELAASVMVEQGGPINVAELSKRAGWGDIGPHEILDSVCECGSTMIRRAVSTGKNAGKHQETCELSWRAYLKQPAAVKLNKAVTDKMKLENPKFTHTYRIVD